MLTHMLEHLEKDLEMNEVYVVMQECLRLLRESGMQIDGLKVPKGQEVRQLDGKARKKPRWRLKTKYVRCGKANCSVCRGGGRHGPYFVKVPRGHSTKSPKEVYVGTNPKGRRRGT